MSRKKTITHLQCHRTCFRSGIKSQYIDCHKRYATLRVMHTQLLPYESDSSRLFSYFAHLPYAIFLDSCASNRNHQGRYDMMSALPSHVLSDEKNIFANL